MICISLLCRAEFETLKNACAVQKSYNLVWSLYFINCPARDYEGPLVTEASLLLTI